MNKTKKLISILLMLLLLISFAACSNNTVNQNTDSETSVSEKDTTTNKIVDENLLTVDITVPASMFDDENPASDELSDDLKEKGFKSAKLNDDGSVTYTMSKSAFSEYKKELKASTEETLNNLSNDYSCIKKVEFNGDFSEININVVKSEYESGMNFLCITQAGFSANIYQAYTNETLKSDIKVIDQDTNEIIDSATYPVEE